MLNFITILKYLRYGWLVIKILIKVTTYYMLKERDMLTEAHNWITDWGPILNLVFYPLSRILVFIYNLRTTLWDTIYFDYILAVYPENIIQNTLLFTQRTLVRNCPTFFFCLIAKELDKLRFVIAIWDIVIAIGDIAIIFCNKTIKAFLNTVRRESGQGAGVSSCTRRGPCIW